MRSFQATAWVRNDETGQFENQDGGSNSFPIPPAPGTYREGEERTPIHAPSLSSQWATPTAKALTAWIGTSTLSFAVMAGYTSMPRPGLAAFIIGGVPGITQWVIDQEYFKKALYQVKNFTEEILNTDIDGDGKVGEEPVDNDETGRVVIRERGTGKKLPKRWEQLPAQDRVMDVWRFTEIVWARQQVGRRTGQKEMRGIPLPSGFKLNDAIHGLILEYLDDAGVIQHQGNTWELTEPPETARGLITSEAW